MSSIRMYKNKFNRLMESPLGNVKPLLNEQPDITTITTTIKPMSRVGNAYRGINLSNGMSIGMEVSNENFKRYDLDITGKNDREIRRLINMIEEKGGIKVKSEQDSRIKKEDGITKEVSFILPEDFDFKNLNV